MLELVKELCRDLTGSQCSVPRVSSWKLVDPSQSSIGVDVADVATGGAGAIAPVNVKAYGSHFSSGLERDARVGGLCTYIHGFGTGAGVGAGWGIPFAGAKGLGKMPDSIKKKVLEAAGGALQGKLVEMLRGLAWGGVSGGTRLIAGPNANGELTIPDFQGSFATVVGLGANFVVNGVSFGMVLISKQRPVIHAPDLIYAKAIGLMGGVGLATSLDIEASGMVYLLSVC